MGRDKHEKERHRERVSPFVMVLIDTLDAPAWRAMSLGARMLYIALRRRNNGRIFLSQRNAAKELGSHHNEIARWFRELRYYGFIVMTAPGALGVDGKGKAPCWRLTDAGYMRDLPTRDFLRWDGRHFKDTEKNPVLGLLHGVCGKPAHWRAGIPHFCGQDRAGNGAHIASIKCARKPAQNYFTIYLLSTACTLQLRDTSC